MKINLAGAVFLLCLSTHNILAAGQPGSIEKRVSRIAVSCTEVGPKDSGHVMVYSIHLDSTRKGMLDLEGFQMDRHAVIRSEDKDGDLRIFLLKKGDLLFRLRRVTGNKSGSWILFFEALRPSFDPQLKQIDCIGQ